MKTLVLENKDMEEIKEWFDGNGYNADEVVIGHKAYYATGFQDADFYEIEEVDNRYSLHSC